MVLWAWRSWWLPLCHAGRVAVPNHLLHSASWRPLLGTSGGSVQPSAWPLDVSHFTIKWTLSFGPGACETVRAIPQHHYWPLRFPLVGLKIFLKEKKETPNTIYCYQRTIQVKLKRLQWNGWENCILDESNTMPLKLKKNLCHFSLHLNN